MNNVVFLEVDGKRYEGFTTISYRRSIEDISGAFFIIATTEGVKYTPFKGTEEYKILINNIPVMSGFTDDLTYGYDADSHQITITGRGKTADIIDNTIIGDVEFKAPISLENIIKTVLEKSKIDLGVVNKVDGLEDFSEEDLIAAEVGDNMFQFLEKYCRKRAVLLTSDGLDNVVITRGGIEELPGVLINTLGGADNNIKAGEIRNNFSKRYNRYLLRSQGIFSSLTTLANGVDGIESKEGEAIDDEIRESRSVEFTNETDSDEFSDTERAKWEANIRRSRSRVFSCKTNNLFLNEKNTIFFEPNKLIRVKDDFCDINATMLIRSVEYNLSLNGGTEVILELVGRDAYSDISSTNKKEKKYDKIAPSADPVKPVLSSAVTEAFLLGTQVGAGA